MLPKRVLMRTRGALLGSVGAGAGAGSAAGWGCAGAGASTVFSAVVLSELLQPEALQNTKKAVQPARAIYSLFIAVIFLKATKVIKERQSVLMLMNRMSGEKECSVEVQNVVQPIDL